MMWMLLEMCWVSCVAVMILQVIEFLYFFFSRKLIGRGSLAGFPILGGSGEGLVDDVVDVAAVVIVEGGGE